MIIKTRKLPPTQSEPARMRATAENGASLTIAYPQGSLSPNLLVARCLARAIGWSTTVQRVSDNQFDFLPRIEKDL